jgi:hypothetical protein
MHEGLKNVINDMFYHFPAAVLISADANLFDYEVTEFGSVLVLIFKYLTSMYCSHS